mgnify:FL=1
MKVDNELVYELAQLAKLEFDNKTVEEMKTDLDAILVFINKLLEVDTEGVSPLIYLSDEVNVLRDDEISTNVSQQQALKNAPEKDSDYFKVPTVLKK